MNLQPSHEIRKGLFLCLLSVFFLGLFTPFDPQQPGLESLQAINPYLNNKFPTKDISSVTDLEIVRAFPNLIFTDPISMIELPDRSGFYIAGKQGKIWEISKNENTSTKHLRLDFSNRVEIDGDAGLMNIVLHPDFDVSSSPNRGYIYALYRYHPLGDRPSCHDDAYVRLSRFTRPDGSDNFDPASEFVLIQQFDTHCWHNGGGMFFGPNDGFLYFTIGDAGGSFDNFGTAQQIDEMLLGGLFRIDVDNDPTRSHPIRRQPVDPSHNLPENSYTQGYGIPNDNPWLDPAGSLLEEFYALGLRSPHRASIDEVSGDIWVGDVGQGSREEISRIVKGGNYQWPFFEGFKYLEAPPSPLIGTSEPPVYDYERGDGNAVIGGFVYRGNKFSSALEGKYIFGDHGSQNIWMLDPSSGAVQYLKTLDDNDGSGDKDGISSFATDQNGNVYILKLYGTNLNGGKIYKLKRSSNAQEPPSLLSQTSAFTNLSTMTPASGLIPYGVNTPLWSDRAVKTRWVAIPNNGSPNQPVAFSPTSEWQFPDGTVFVKHFELALDLRNPGVTRPVETRFLIREADGGVYGVTYKWNAQATDADLLLTSDTSVFSIINEDGSAGTQKWEFPSRVDCKTCHNTNAGFVLGVKTWHLNGDFTYPQTGVTDNQLHTWEHLGIFGSSMNHNDIPTFLKAEPLQNQSASLETRVRSYLDANCSFCHRPGGVEGVFDGRFTTPIANQNLINTLGISRNTPPDHVIVKPGDPANSELWIRDNSIGAENSMPPLAKNVRDDLYISVLTAWINGLGGSGCENVGDPCDDGDPCTAGETIQADCTCGGGTLVDNDNDSICDSDPSDNCQGPNTGDPCDDGDPNTHGDQIDQNCVCTGTPSTSDEICRTISRGEDDAEEQTSGNVAFGSTDIELIRENSDQIVGLRFENIAIPNGATIDQAFIQFQTDEPNNIDPCDLIFSGQSIDNAPSFTTEVENISSRSKTVANVTWSPPNWNTVPQRGPDQKTPNLALIIQEIVNRPGFVSGNAIAIIVEGNGKRVAESFNGDQQGAPELCISYSTGGGGCSGVTVGDPCDDGNPCTINTTIQPDCSCGGGQTQDQDGDGFCGAQDCDDNPETGAGCHTDCLTFYRDQDGDGYGDPAITVNRCTAPDGYVGNSDDCNDSDIGIGRVGDPCDDGDICTTGETIQSDCSCGGGTNQDLDGDGVCGGQDCDDDPITGATCSDNCQTFFRDQDQDGLGDPAVSTQRCIAPQGYVSNSEDCDDTNSSIGKVGDPCDDQENCTTGEVLQADCSCGGGSIVDEDNDGVCDFDPEDDCEGPNSGSPCDDNDPLTMDDRIQEDCSCHGTQVDLCANGNPKVTISSENFDSDWGIWNDGGKNCTRSTKHANSSPYSIQIRNKGNSSSMYTDVLDLSVYNAVEISFEYLPSSMEGSDAFRLEISNNGGNSYVLIREWTTADFSNKQWHHESLVIDGTLLSSATSLRFICNAGNNGDQVHIDDVRIDGCASTLSGKALQTSRFGIENRTPHTSKLKVSVFPNPFESRFVININKPDPALQRAALQIMDISGRVFYEKLDCPFNQNFLVDLEDLNVPEILLIRILVPGDSIMVRAVRLSQ